MIKLLFNIYTNQIFIPCLLIGLIRNKIWNILLLLFILSGKNYKDGQGSLNMNTERKIISIWIIYGYFCLMQIRSSLVICHVSFYDDHFIKDCFPFFVSFSNAFIYLRK